MKLKEFNPRVIFSSRVENYARYRSNYPNIIVDFLHQANRKFI